LNHLFDAAAVEAGSHVPGKIYGSESHCCLLRLLTVRQLEPVGNAVVTEQFAGIGPEKTRDSLRNCHKASLRPFTKDTRPSRIGNPLALPSITTTMRTLSASIQRPEAVEFLLFRLYSKIRG
jgi:hypothetical protein